MVRCYVLNLLLQFNHCCVHHAFIASILLMTVPKQDLHVQVDSAIDHTQAALLRPNPTGAHSLRKSFQAFLRRLSSVIHWNIFFTEFVQGKTVRQRWLCIFFPKTGWKPLVWQWSDIEISGLWPDRPLSIIFAGRAIQALCHQTSTFTSETERYPQKRRFAL